MGESLMHKTTLTKLSLGGIYGKGGKNAGLIKKNDQETLSEKKARIGYMNCWIKIVH